LTDELIIEGLKKLVKLGATKTGIEKDLSMPKNVLSGIVAAKRPIPPKWREKLIGYINLWPELETLRKEKITRIKEGNYNEAADARDKERKLLGIHTKESPILNTAPVGQRIEIPTNWVATEEFMGIPIPEELTGLPLAVWKNNIKIKAKLKK
jgi:hypothetical protein